MVDDLFTNYDAMAVRGLTQDDSGITGVRLAARDALGMQEHGILNFLQESMNLGNDHERIYESILDGTIFGKPAKNSSS